MTIYEGGIVELISGGIRAHFMYEKLEKDSLDSKTVCIIVEKITGDDETNYYSYDLDNREYEEIAEEEF